MDLIFVFNMFIVFNWLKHVVRSGFYIILGMIMSRGCSFDLSIGFGAVGYSRY